MYKKVSSVAMIALLGMAQQVESKWWQRSKSEKPAKPSPSLAPKQTKESRGILSRFGKQKPVDFPPTPPTVVPETPQARQATYRAMRERFRAEAEAKRAALPERRALEQERKESEMRQKEGKGEETKRRDPGAIARATVRTRKKYEGKKPWE